MLFGVLANYDARRTVEFHKDPRDIYETVDHVVYYCDTGKQPKANDEKHRYYSWWTEVDDSDKSDSSSDEASWAASVGDKPNRGQNWQTKKQKLENASEMQPSS